MEFEKLALEVSAMRAGLTAVTPRVLRGESGVEHRFDLVFSDGTRSFAFDFYERVTDVEVVSSYAKKLDTGASVNIVSLRGSATEEARQLALSYEVKILNPKAAETFFALQQTEPRRTVG